MIDFQNPQLENLKDLNNDNDLEKDNIDINGLDNSIKIFEKENEFSLNPREIDKTDDGEISIQCQTNGNDLKELKDRYTLEEWEKSKLSQRQVVIKVDKLNIFWDLQQNENKIEERDKSSQNLSSLKNNDQIKIMKPDVNINIHDSKEKQLTENGAEELTFSFRKGTDTDSNCKSKSKPKPKERKRNPNPTRRIRKKPDLKELEIMGNYNNNSSTEETLAAQEAEALAIKKEIERPILKIEESSEMLSEAVKSTLCYLLDEVCSLKAEEDQESEELNLTQRRQARLSLRRRNSKTAAAEDNVVSDGDGQIKTPRRTPRLKIKNEIKIENTRVVDVDDGQIKNDNVKLEIKMKTENKTDTSNSIPKAWQNSEIFKKTLIVKLKRLDVIYDNDVEGLIKFMKREKESQRQKILKMAKKSIAKAKNKSKIRPKPKSRFAKLDDDYEDEDNDEDYTPYYDNINNSNGRSKRRKVAVFKEEDLGDFDIKPDISNTDSNVKKSKFCTFCEIYVTEYFLHMREVHGREMGPIKGFNRNNRKQCEYCKEYFNAQYLPRHIWSHTGYNPFKCDHPGCNRVFKSKFSLRIHQATHSRGKANSKIRYQGPDKNGKKQCKYCKKWFNGQYLPRHIWTHLDKNPYKCDVPGCSYSTKSNYFLNVHKASHGPVNKKISCHLCPEPRYFTHNHTRKVHLYTYHKMKYSEITKIPNL